VAYDLEDGNFKNLLSSCVSGNGEYFEAEINDLDDFGKLLDKAKTDLFRRKGSLLQRGVKLFAGLNMTCHLSEPIHMCRATLFG